MSAFPSIAYTYESREEWVDDRSIERATNGDARGRSLYAATKRKFTLEFELLDDTDKGSIESHYAAHRAITFTFLWRDGVTYTCLYGKPPRLGLQKPGLWKLGVDLEEA